MENKKFSDLKVGDMLHIYDKYSENKYKESKLTNVRIANSYFVLCCSFGSYVESYIVDYNELDFYIVESNAGILTKCISTSMDKLLLELEE